MAPAIARHCEHTIACDARAASDHRGGDGDSGQTARQTHRTERPGTCRGKRHATTIAAGKKNRLKMKNNNQLCPLRLANPRRPRPDGHPNDHEDDQTEPTRPRHRTHTPSCGCSSLPPTEPEGRALCRFGALPCYAHCIEPGGRLPPPIRLPPRSQRSPWHTGSGISADCSGHYRAHFGELPSRTLGRAA